MSEWRVGWLNVTKYDTEYYASDGTLNVAVVSENTMFAMKADKYILCVMGAFKLLLQDMVFRKRCMGLLSKQTIGPT